MMSHAHREPPRIDLRPCEVLICFDLAMKEDAAAKPVDLFFDVWPVPDVLQDIIESRTSRQRPGDSGLTSDAFDSGCWAKRTVDSETGWSVPALPNHFMTTALYTNARPDRFSVQPFKLALFGLPFRVVIPLRHHDTNKTYSQHVLPIDPWMRLHEELLAIAASTLHNLRSAARVKVHIRRNVVYFALPARPCRLPFAAGHLAEPRGCNALEGTDACKSGRRGSCQSGPVHGTMTRFQ